MFLAILMGVACLSLGMIGLAALLGKAVRARLTFFAGVFPLGVVLVGGILAHDDMHGVFSSVLDSNVAILRCRDSDDDDCP